MELSLLIVFEKFRINLLEDLFKICLQGNSGQVSNYFPLL